MNKDPQENKPKYAFFKTNRGSLELTRDGAVIYQWMGVAQSIKHIYATVSRAKASMEQARMSGNLLPTESGQGLIEFVLIAVFLFLAYLAIRGLIATGVF